MLALSVLTSWLLTSVCANIMVARYVCADIMVARYVCVDIMVVGSLSTGITCCNHIAYSICELPTKKLTNVFNIILKGAELLP